jgi:hypothetical protein
MKKRSTITIGLAAAFILAAMAVLVYGGKPKGEMLEYEVISIEAKGWVVTARETATGNVVKFRLPPAVFKGKTFDFNLETLQPGQRFSVRGPRNTQLDQLIVKQPLKSMAAGPSSEQGKPGMAETPMITPPGEPPMPWEILHVDPQKWIVTARNRLTHQTVKVQVHPETFNGFRFRANLRGINQGQGFSIVTPNDLPMKDSCTLLKIMK